MRIKLVVALVTTAREALPSSPGDIRAYDVKTGTCVAFTLPTAGAGQEKH